MLFSKGYSKIGVNGSIVNGGNVMNSKILSMIRNRTLRHEDEAKIVPYIFSFNLTRGFYLFATNTLILSLLLTYFVFSYKETKASHFLISSFLCAVLMVIILIFLIIFRVFKKKPALYLKRYFISLFLTLNCIMLIIPLFISLLENNIILFFAFLMLVSTLFFIIPIVIFFQYGLVCILFMIFAPYFAISYADYLSTLLIILVSCLVAYTIYSNKRIEFQLFSNFKEKNLVLKESNKELSEYSYSDALTGVNNRRRIEDLLKNNWKYCKANKLKLSVLFIDVDNFKKYNDCYGHLKGDECLVKIATTIESLCTMVSETHYCAMGRYGGEEFIIMLPDTDKDRVLELGRQVCKKIVELNIPHSCNEEYPYVTISCGATTFVPDEQKRILYILETADRALYYVKRAGKNNVMHYEDIFPDF